MPVSTSYYPSSYISPVFAAFCLGCTRTRLKSSKRRSKSKTISRRRLKGKIVILGWKETGNSTTYWFAKLSSSSSLHCLLLSKGVCYSFLHPGELGMDGYASKTEEELAIEAFTTSLDTCMQPSSSIQLSKLYTQTNRTEEAIAVLEECLDAYPQDPDMLKTIGLVHLQASKRN